MTSTKTDLTVIILTFNEELHIQRAIESVMNIASTIWIVDSFSTDRTKDIVNSFGAQFVQHTFVNQATQFQWALDNCSINTEWVMRLDADEYLTNALIEELLVKLKVLPDDISGIVLKRQVHFMGRWIRHGGYYPVELLRIWRHGAIQIEQRWMDEHFILTRGRSVIFNHDIIDDNLNTLSWWTTKHNDYSTREAVDFLRKKYNLTGNGTPTTTELNQSVRRKRWYKENVYYKLPLLSRSLFYFLYRYIIRLGFMDGKKGFVWHFLQGFWYRFLVDAKVMQIEWWAQKENLPVKTIIEQKFKYKL